MDSLTPPKRQIEILLTIIKHWSLYKLIFMLLWWDDEKLQCCDEKKNPTNSTSFLRKCRPVLKRRSDSFYCRKNDLRIAASTTNLKSKVEVVVEDDDRIKPAAPVLLETKKPEHSVTKFYILKELQEENVEDSLRFELNFWNLENYRNVVTSTDFQRSKMIICIFT